MASNDKRMFVIGYIHGRASLDNHDAAGLEGEKAFEQWVNEQPRHVRAQSQSEKLYTMESILVDLRRFTGDNATFDVGGEGWLWVCDQVGLDPNEVKKGL